MDRIEQIRQHTVGVACPSYVFAPSLNPAQNEHDVLFYGFGSREQKSVLHGALIRCDDRRVEHFAFLPMAHIFQATHVAFYGQNPVSTRLWESSEYVLSLVKYLNARPVERVQLFLFPLILWGDVCDYWYREREKLKGFLFVRVDVSVKDLFLRFSAGGA